MSGSEQQNVQQILGDMARGNETGQQLVFSPADNSIRQYNPKDPSGESLRLTNEAGSFAAA